MTRGQLLDLLESRASRLVCRLVGHRWTTWPAGHAVVAVCSRKACHGHADATRWLP